jgi:DnaK suppressor protein
MDAAHQGLIASLGERRVQTEQAIHSLEDRERPVELDQTLQGRVSRIDAITQQQMAAASRSRLKIELGRIDAALARAGRGEYGLCCRCHEAIDPGRLQADPSGPFCLDCVEEIAAERAESDRRR